MPTITVLDQNTINKIAAGEVIERPASVVKELLENAIDAQATAVTVEIKDGGCSLIRITDNGCGIPKDQIPLAFLRHATSKIRKAEDLMNISSLGFRGEALASIASVSQVELISKTADSLTGSRYQIEGGQERSMEEVGSPDGTTIIARNLFYNVPARKKFLKTPMTEGAHVASLVEKIALSHPDISVRLIQNNQNKLYTSGNHNIKDLIYTVFGREIAANLLTVDGGEEGIRVTGYIGKPVIARSNRNYENYFINGRYIKSNIICKAIEEAYKPFMMQHKYPFTMLHLNIDPQTLDVNVHPTKMELRFSDGETVYRAVLQAITQALSHKELIPKVELEETMPGKKETASFVRENAPGWHSQQKQQAGAPKSASHSEKAAAGGPDLSGLPFSTPGAGSQPERSSSDAGSLLAPPLSGAAAQSASLSSDTVSHPARLSSAAVSQPAQPVHPTTPSAQPAPPSPSKMTGAKPFTPVLPSQPSGLPKTAPMMPEQVMEQVQKEIQQEKQLDLFEEKFLDPKKRISHKLIGQLFDTYWLVEYDGKLFIIDQHAAHEKVLYERTMNTLKTRTQDTQLIEPPVILTLNRNEEVLLQQYMSYFTKMGFEIEPFGGREYAVRGVPANLFSIAKKELLLEMIDGLSEDTAVKNPDIIYEKVASMSCKAAVKGHHRMSAAEANELIDELLTLDNPYACPHGRPTIISMSKYELEKKFKRIV